MDPNTILQIVNSVMSIVDKLLDQLPSYLQRKKEKIFKLTQEIFEENQKEYGTGPNSKDEAKLAHLSFELEALLKIFAQIQKMLTQSVSCVFLGVLTEAFFQKNAKNGKLM